MSNPLLYFIKVSLITGILYSFYRFFLNKASFHNMNRFLLLFIIFFSLICPVLEFNGSDTYNFFKNGIWINEWNEISGVAPGLNYENHHHVLQTGQYIFIVYLLGTLSFLLRAIHQVLSIHRLKRQAKISKEDSLVFVYSDNIKAPFSFFRWIFLPSGFIHFEGKASIIQHEKVHVKQLHSLDLILSEAFCIAFWFNPFVFLLKKSLKNVHEFIADNQIINSSMITVNEYLRLLVTSAELNFTSGMTSSFKSLTIKKRIEMIIKNKSSKSRKALYFFLLPVIAFMVQSFSGFHNVKDIPSIRPVKGGEITLEFGYTGTHPITKEQFTHGGVDIKVTEGTKVVATASGVVVEATEDEGWGKLVVIKHGDTYETLYAHLQKIVVAKGDKVKSGQTIGLSGNTGYSTGPHLHYEVHKNYERVNPEEYFD